MSLPILKATTVITPQSAVRHWLQSELVLSQALSEPADIEGAQVFCDPSLADLIPANRVVDAFTTDVASADLLLRAVDKRFADAGCRCLQWLINPTVPADVAAYFASELDRRGFRKRSTDIFLLTQRLSFPESTSLQIVPARASYEQTRALFSTLSMGVAASRWLDEPRIDGLLAMRRRTAVGHVSVLSLGQVGRIQHLFVSEPQRRQGIGRALLRRGLEICSRSLFHHVFATADDPATRSLLEHAGFSPFTHADAYDLI